MFHTLGLIGKSIPPIHKKGHIFVVISAVITFLLGVIWEPLGWIGLALTMWVAAFFRDPPRVTPVGDNLVISPGDGIISQIMQAPLPDELGKPGEQRIRISIFLNVFDVHINRVPVTGTVQELHYSPGTFVNASLDKASESNERQTVLLKTLGGKEVVVVQIAGWVARRIVCELQDQQQVRAGERYGLIRFGSRVDVYLPEGVNPVVVAGQAARGGETIFAYLDKNMPSLEGEIR